ncbi:hypothetical protein LR48_Vigan01g108400 [Vigna angularis]|uniref:Uncharacterized protein n=1 Tax=Phaseolus angularis TaxID=3914 RepID=A0A0L9TN01_PHAAN|nr:hypothetical protein LR48_Vigan01g108400 [Vigna angularis]
MASVCRASFIRGVAGKHRFQQHYEDYGNRPPPSPVAEHVVPPTGRSGKGSCSAFGAPGDDMDETRPCQPFVNAAFGLTVQAWRIGLSGLALLQWALPFSGTSSFWCSVPLGVFTPSLHLEAVAHTSQERVRREEEEESSTGAVLPGEDDRS